MLKHNSADSPKLEQLDLKMFGVSDVGGGRTTLRQWGQLQHLMTCALLSTDSCAHRTIPTKESAAAFTAVLWLMAGS